MISSLFDYGANVYFEKQQRFGLRQTTEATIRQHFQHEDDAKSFAKNMLRKQGVFFENIYLDSYHQYPNLIQLRITFIRNNKEISLVETMVEDKI